MWMEWAGGAPNRTMLCNEIAEASGMGASYALYPTLVGNMALAIWVQDPEWVQVEVFVPLGVPGFGCTLDIQGLRCLIWLHPNSVRPYICDCPGAALQSEVVRGNGWLVAIILILH